MGIYFNPPKTKEFRLKLRKESSVPERILWKYIRDKKIGYKFRRQHGIGPYVVDFYCPQLKLIIEIDGGYHDDPDVQQRDAIREKYLQDQGLVIKHYTGRQIND